MWSLTHAYTLTHTHTHTHTQTHTHTPHTHRHRQIMFVGVCVWGGMSVWVCGCVNVVRDVCVENVCMYEHV